MSGSGTIMPSRRDIMLGGLMVAAAGATWARLPRESLSATDGEVLDGILPASVGDWRVIEGQGLVVPPEQEARADAVYSHVLTNTYQRGGAAPIMLLIAYDQRQSGMLQIHRPEACYPAQGFTLSGEQPVALELGGTAVDARFLTAVNGQRNEQILYWTRIGCSFPTTYDGQRSAVIGYNLRQQIPDGALIRISAIDPDVRRARASLIGFAETLYSGAGKLGRGLLAGPCQG